MQERRRGGEGAGKKGEGGRRREKGLKGRDEVIESGGRKGGTEEGRKRETDTERKRDRYNPIQRSIQRFET
jgi:hypothetical protein